MADPPVWALFSATAAYSLISGFNSGGNLMGSFVGARAFTLTGAALVLLCGAAAAPWVLGTAVAHTVVFAVVALPRLGPTVLLAAAAGAVAALLLCWWRSLPTNTTLALLGALAGAGLAAAGPGAVVWQQAWKVVLSLALALAVGAASGALAWAGLHAVLRFADERAPRVLRGLQGVSGLLQGFAYGGNDAQRAMGLFALLSAWGTAAGRAALAAGRLPVPAWAVWVALGTFGLGMVAGGARIAAAVGERFYHVRAGDALAAQVAAGVTVIAAAAAGWPVSSTQTATSALLAVGAARRISRPRWSQAGRIALAWAVTLPLSLLFGAAVYALEARA